MSFDHLQATSIDTAIQSSKQMAYLQQRYMPVTIQTKDSDGNILSQRSFSNLFAKRLSWLDNALNFMNKIKLNLQDISQCVISARVCEKLILLQTMKSHLPKLPITSFAIEDTIQIARNDATIKNYDNI